MVRFSCTIASIIFIIVCLAPGIDSHSTTLRPLVHNGSYGVAGTAPPLRYREHDLFIPASTIKILTSLAALELLGKNFHFETHLFLDEKKNLFIKGFGDPFLTSETLLLIAQKLQNQDLHQINRLLLDASVFSLNGKTASKDNSANPYDAPNGALAVNFNSLPIHISENGRISSGEPQTPLLPLMVERGSVMVPGKHRLNINSSITNGSLPASLRYTGELFTAQLQSKGIITKNGFAIEKVPPDLSPILVYRNEMVLEEVIRACMKYSNNFIANQLFLLCGMHAYNSPATWQKGRAFIAEYTKHQLHLPPDQIDIWEGSGISRKNRISTAAMLRILEHFKPYANLLNRQNSWLIKSGTLNGVYCYGGYFTTSAGLESFAIFLNQQQNTRDELLQMLYRRYLNQ